MAYRRRRFSRSFRRRRYGRSLRSLARRKYNRIFKSKFRKTGTNKVYKFTRFLTADITTPGTAPATGAINFSLDDLSSYTEFTTLFDQYKISGVKCEFRPRVTNNSAGSVPLDNGTFYYYTDHTDTGTTAGTDIFERQNVHVKNMNGTSYFSLFLKPTYLTYAAATTAGEHPVVPSRKWVTTDNSLAAANIVWNGIKWRWTDYAGYSTAGPVMHMRFTYYLKFKQVK